MAGIENPLCTETKKIGAWEVCYNDLVRPEEPRKIYDLERKIEGELISRKPRLIRYLIRKARETGPLGELRHLDLYFLFKGLFDEAHKIAWERAGLTGVHWGPPVDLCGTGGHLIVEANSPEEARMRVTNSKEAIRTYLSLEVLPDEPIEPAPIYR